MPIENVFLKCLFSNSIQENLNHNTVCIATNWTKAFLLMAKQRILLKPLLRHTLVDRKWILQSQDSLWIDYERNSAHLIKELEPNCSCFQGHFPSNPIFPGVWLLELQFQTAAVYLLQVFKTHPLNVPWLKTCRFRQLVRPHDKLDIVVEEMNSSTTPVPTTESNPKQWNFQGKIYRQSKLVAESSFLVNVLSSWPISLTTQDEHMSLPPTN